MRTTGRGRARGRVWRDDGLVTVAPLLERIGDFADFLWQGEDARAAARCGLQRPPGGRRET
jgi:hypothetical protein